LGAGAHFSFGVKYATAPQPSRWHIGRMNDMPSWTSPMQEVTPLADLPAAQAMFLDLLGRLKVGAEERATLAGLWREPWRRYHTAGHAGLLWGRHLAHGGDPDDLVAAHAIAYHDAVYCVGSPDNESRSVALWRAHAAGLPAELRDSVARAILATADHAADHDDPDACWLVDLDLTPLGEPWPEFKANSRVLRQEMGTPDDRMIPGQAAFLRRLLALSRIFRSKRNGAELYRVYEATARSNLARVLGEAA
jgi:predicted metal-dependent HD superfamily phosphohydrolase